MQYFKEIVFPFSQSSESLTYAPPSGGEIMKHRAYTCSPALQMLR